MKAFQKKALPAAVSLALGLGSLVPAVAQAGWYVGAGVGSSSFDQSVATDSTLAGAIDQLSPDVTNFDVDDSDTGWKVFAGYQFNDYFALEGHYVDFGAVKANASGTYDGGEGSFTGSGKVDVTGFGMSAVGSIPFLEHFAVLAKLGVTRWMADQSGTTFLIDGSDYCASNDCSANDNGIDVSFGAGLAWHITDQISVRAEWEDFGLGSDSVDLYSASVTWGF
jgi:OmpA-OmpF porin, OOP family